MLQLPCERSQDLYSPSDRSVSLGIEWCAQDPLPMQTGFLDNGGDTEPTHAASQQGFPLMPRQTQRQARLPIVPTARTPALVAANETGSRVCALQCNRRGTSHRSN